MTPSWHSRRRGIRSRSVPLGRFFVLLLLAGTTIAAAAWREDVLSLHPGPVAPPPPEISARYAFGWGGIEAAEAQVELSRSKDALWTAKVKGGTSGFVRSLWRLDADYESRLREADWTTISSRLREHYARYRTDEKAEFRPGGVRSWRESTKEGAKAPRWRNFYVPGLRDIAAALLLARSQPLRPGDRFSLAVFPGQWIYLVRIKVEEKEIIRWQGQAKETFRVSLEIDSINKDYTLSPHRKFQRGTVWVSNDPLRLPLRVEVKVFVGSVFAELKEVSAR
jgi:hypothetical protein